MPIFISYSHKDKEFVDKLTMQLVQRNVNVWLDRWELAVGDSIIDRVQEAVDGASALLVILSKASTGSEWCKKELSAGLLRELEERRVVVMPVMLEDCDVPVFARGKMFADFRTDFDDGLRSISEGVAKVTNSAMARAKEPDFNTDWSIDWGFRAGQLSMMITYLQIPSNYPYSCLTTVEIVGSKTASEIFQKISKESHPDFAKLHVVKLIVSFFDKFGEMKALLSDEKSKIKLLEIKGPELRESYNLRIMTRRLGEDTGRDVLIHVSSLVRYTLQHMASVLRGK
ncbi:toll/interleukin-1 receptor domain-containing protein [Vogesella sp. XCS3]|uniref:toll/interleukin-1 receptor domain-containing protein n=1 Tax=Vogesella sp. XCS3 TaxID=2877939 RepID=UPI001D09BD50|nr:toll/interleukin-1 receptor domain-containing protein [Vogesella sp. XCS3]UDM16064.1 toll/interleukin-1 receptor domain-containing protein [Vogesella sp. XCS3]